MERQAPVTAWTQCVRSRESAQRRLLCFPHAGGSPYAFREWARGLPRHEVHAVCYPGRAERFGEPVPTDLLEMAYEIALAARPLLDRPLALFGHSMGATVAYETARLLAADGATPAHLFVSGARAPQLARRTPLTADMTDDDVIATLTELGGTDAELLDNPMFREVILPYVGGDLRLLAGYTYRSGGTLDCPVTALVGADDPRVTAEQCADWRGLTRGAFRLHTVPGGHFYLADDPPFALVEELSGAERSAPHDGRGGTGDGGGTSEAGEADGRAEAVGTGDAVSGGSRDAARRGAP